MILETFLLQLTNNTSMKNVFLKIVSCALLGASALTSCNKEPDESNLYTFTGQTIRDYLEANDSIYHQFNIIVKRAGYDRMLATYGEYTCYAPINEGVNKYIDSLYNDETNKKEPHNGLTENSINGLSDEMCKEIVRYHISAMKNRFVEELSSFSGKEITTMLNAPFISKLHDDGIVRFNSAPRVLEFDKELTNGYVHTISEIIPRTTRYVGEVLETRPEFKIFYEGLEKTGLLDSLLDTKKRNADGSVKTYNLSNVPGGPAGSDIYFTPEECMIKYTIFAETDKVLAEHGITDFESLKAKCADWYGNAADWYEYPNKADNPISTGDDYTYTYNVVNMYYRYHILKAGMPVSKLVFERNLSNAAWNYAFGAEPQDYYETILPHTLMKIWQPYSQPTGNPDNIWINRYRANNTLTDEVGTFGKDETHQIIRPGCQIVRQESNILSSNGYIHSLDRPLIYDDVVPKGVLNERMRFESGTMFYELINNNIRFATEQEISAMNKFGNSGEQSRIPLDYFDNLISFNTKTKLYWCTTKVRRAFNCDKLLGYDENDYIFRLPPVPTGDYEIRTLYPPGPKCGLQQYYIGTSTDPSSMIPLGGPIDGRYPNSDIEADRITSGYLRSTEFDDYGVASDLIMRTKGYMRAPASFARGGENAVKRRISSPAELITSTELCCRYNEGYATCMIRKILGRTRIEQGKEYWIRMKNLLKGYDQLGYSIDFIELVPLHIVNSQDFTEDWY